MCRQICLQISRLWPYIFNCTRMQKHSKTLCFIVFFARLRKKFWRHGGESNSHTRICSPLHHHSATAPCGGRFTESYKELPPKVQMDLKMAPWAGFEPATGRLTVACSTAELPGNTCGKGMGFITTQSLREKQALSSVRANSPCPDPSTGWPRFFPAAPA